MLLLNYFKITNSRVLQQTQQPINCGGQTTNTTTQPCRQTLVRALPKKGFINFETFFNHTQPHQQITFHTKWRKLSLLLLLLIGCSINANAQQAAQFSQYMFNGIYINPAYAGYKERLNVQMFDRNQWTGIERAPKTISLSVDAIANDDNVGLAFQVSNDQLGAQSNLAACANYAYRISMNDDGTSRLALGLGVGITQLGINGALLMPNYTEVTQPVGMQTTIVPDARIGIYFSNDTYFAGLSADNLVAKTIDKSRYSFLPQPKPQYYLTAGMLVPLSEDIVLKPSFLIKDDRAGPTSLDVNAFIILAEKFWVGAAYRSAIKIYYKPNLQNNLDDRNSVIGAIQIMASDNLRVGYAYDFSVGAFQGQSGGTHEISIGYYFDRKSERMFSPRFF
jgi:type IX secretion system PorP/SprF family membrane protein